VVFPPFVTQADPIPYHPIDRSFDRSTVVVVPRDERRVRTARTARTARHVNSPPSPTPPVVAVASRRVASRLAPRRSNARALAIAPPRATAPAVVVVGPATHADDACAAHRANKFASARAPRVVVVVVDIARAELRRRAPRPRSSRRAPRVQGWGLGF